MLKSIKTLQNTCGTYAIAKMMFNRGVSIEHALIMLAYKSK